MSAPPSELELAQRRGDVWREQVKLDAIELERLRATLREVLGWFVPSGDHMYALRPSRDFTRAADVLPERSESVR